MSRATEMMELVLRRLGEECYPDLMGITQVGSSIRHHTNESLQEIDLILFLKSLDGRTILKIGRAASSIPQEAMGIGIEITSGTTGFVQRIGQGTPTLRLHLLPVTVNPSGKCEPFGYGGRILHNMSKSRRLLSGRDFFDEIETVIPDHQEVLHTYRDYLTVNLSRLVDLGLSYTFGRDPYFLAANAVEIGKKMIQKSVAPMLTGNEEDLPILSNKRSLRLFCKIHYPEVSREIENLFSASKELETFEGKRERAEALYEDILKIHRAIAARFKCVMSRNQSGGGTQ